MPKQQVSPQTMVYPAPGAMVSCAGMDGRPNIIAIAWTGVLSSRPPKVGIGVTSARHSHRLISETGEYVINIPSASMVEALDYCGVVSGRDVDKFAELELTAATASILQYAPLIDECPISLECRVEKVLSLGSHDYFVAEIVAAHIAEEWCVPGGCRPSPDPAQVIAYMAGEYYTLGSSLGSHGFSRKSDG